jgi:4-carboxymuconolactone decarboxylase
MSDERAQKGLEVFAELLGSDSAAAIERVAGSAEFGAPVSQLALEFAFGSVWSRDGLTRKQRSLVTLGILLALRQIDEFKNHVRIALTHGLSMQELEEVLVHALPYAGFPAVSLGMRAMIEVFRERGLDMESRTSQENGLL